MTKSWIFGMSDEKVLTWSKGIGWVDIPRERFDKNYVEDPPESGAYRLRTQVELHEIESDS